MSTEPTGRDDRGGKALPGAEPPEAADAKTAVALLQADEFFDQNPFAYFLMRAGGSIVRVNKRFCDLIGFSGEESVGKQIEDFLSRSNVPELHGYHREKLRHRDRTFEYECNLASKSGTDVRCVISMNIVTQGGFALGSLRDVTEERRLSTEIQKRNQDLQEAAARLRAAQEELQRSTQMATLGEVSGRVAHEILNPLTAVTARIRGLEGKSATLAELGGFLGETAEGLKANPAVAEQAETLTAVKDALEEHRTDVTKDLAFVTAELDRIQRLVDDMRGATRAAIERQRIKLADLVRYCHEVMTDPLARGSCGWQLVCPDDVWIEVDRGEMIQVITNLVRNAIEAMVEGDTPPPHQVTVSATTLEGNMAEVRIRDTGKGVPPEVAPLIFEPNFTTRKTGTGFGLAIARRLARAHQGDLVLAAPDGAPGAAFVLTLPCTVQQAVTWEG